jgi:hypothetical protein
MSLSCFVGGNLQVIFYSNWICITNFGSGLLWCIYFWRGGRWHMHCLIYILCNSATIKFHDVFPLNAICLLGWNLMTWKNMDDVNAFPQTTKDSYETFNWIHIHVWMIIWQLLSQSKRLSILLREACTFREDIYLFHDVFQWKLCRFVT